MNAPSNFRKIQVPQSNVLLYWDKVPGAVGYYLYYRPFNSAWVKIPTLIPDSKCQYPLLPTDPIPDDVVSWDPVYFKQVVLSQDYTTDFKATAYDGGVESPDSVVLTYTPPEIMVTTERDDPEKRST